MPHGMDINENGEIIITGRSESLDGDRTNSEIDRLTWNIKLDSLGNLIWEESHDMGFFKRIWIWYIQR